MESGTILKELVSVFDLKELIHGQWLMVWMLNRVETNDCVFIGIVLNIKWKK
jgi:hypothetical protein